jgi:membrane-associated protease RseP (regulator of RpoE activity)
LRERVRIVIRFPTVILVLLLIVFDGNPDALMPLAAAFCHEAGHLCAMQLFGINVREIEITMFGAEIRSLPSAQSLLRQIIIFGAGAAVNLFCAGVLLFLHAAPALDFFAVCSLVLALLNLLPIRTLDGGCIAEAVLISLTPVYADRILDALSAAALAVLWLAAVYLLLCFNGNVSLMLFCMYLFVSLYME